MINKEFPITVLLYHQIGEHSDKRANLDCFCYRKEFIKQLNFLKENEIPVITLYEAHQILDSGIEINSPMVVLTFDDGYEDFYHIVYPILIKMNFRAHLYIPAGRINKSSNWMSDSNSYLNLMNNNQTREVANNNVLIGSHSMTHKKLSFLDYNDLKYEVKENKIVLEDIICTEVTDFSYPHGNYDRRVIEEVLLAGYKTAVTCLPKSYSEESKLLEIPRIYMTSKDTLDTFKNKVSRFFKI